MTFDNNKIAIIGCGKVGMTAAYAIFLAGIVDELVLFGRDRSKLIGEKLDLEHAASFTSKIKITASDNYQDLENSDVIVITAGAAQKPGETRLDLAQKNIAITTDIITQAIKYAPQAIYLLVSNPVDVLTYQASKIANLAKGQIFGSGTVLDTSRFRFHLSEFLNVNPRSIHAYILGEHGDSSFPVLSSATVGGQSLNNFPGFNQAQALEAYQQTRDAAYKIIDSKGATYYAIGAVIKQIVKNILKDSKTVLPVSVPLQGQYGYQDVAISVPCIIGRNGVEEILETKLSWEEKQALEKSVSQIKKYLN